MDGVWFTTDSYHGVVLNLNSCRDIAVVSSESVGVAAQIGDGKLPSLFRFLFIVGLLAAAGFGAMWALVTFVEPQPREMSQSIPPSKLTGK